jgi:hypothetical protein
MSAAIQVMVSVDITWDALHMFWNWHCDRPARIAGCMMKLQAVHICISSMMSLDHLSKANGHTILYRKMDKCHVPRQKKRANCCAVDSFRIVRLLYFGAYVCTDVRWASVYPVHVQNQWLHTGAQSFTILVVGIKKNLTGLSQRR